jgi:hypothetical protein
MSRYQIGLFVCCVAASLAFSASDAQAGYVTARIKTARSTDSLATCDKDDLTLESASTGACGTADHPDSPQKDNVRGYIPAPVLEADCPAPGTGVPTSGGSTSGSGSGATPLALAAAQEVPRPAMTGWLVGERLFYHPDPIVSGLFHPPRLRELRNA